MERRKASSVESSHTLLPSCELCHCCGCLGSIPEWPSRETYRLHLSVICLGVERESTYPWETIPHWSKVAQWGVKPWDPPGCTFLGANSNRYTMLRCQRGPPLREERLWGGAPAVPDTGLNVRQCRWDLNPIPSNPREQCHGSHTGERTTGLEFGTFASSSGITTPGYLI